jgi:DNA-binding XRE family transcriptional regulator
MKLTIPHADDPLMLSRELKALRARYGISQVEMAAELGIDQSQVSRFETADNHYVKKIAEYFAAIQRLRDAKGFGDTHNTEHNPASGAGGGGGGPAQAGEVQTVVSHATAIQNTEGAVRVP